MKEWLNLFRLPFFEQYGPRMDEVLEEVQDLLRASHGVNVGLRYLDGAFNYDANGVKIDVDFGIPAITHSA